MGYEIRKQYQVKTMSDGSYQSLTKVFLFFCIVFNLAACSPSKPMLELQVFGQDRAHNPSKLGANKSAWVVNNGGEQTVRFTLKIRKNNDDGLALNEDSVTLSNFGPLTNRIASGDDYIYWADIPLNPTYNEGDFPVLSPFVWNDNYQSRFVDYTATANYGEAATAYSSKAQIEVLRPFCQVPVGELVDGQDESNRETKWLGMNFEVPEGEAPAGGWPVLMFIHGGGETEGNHLDFWRYTERVRSDDYAVANIHYRLVDISDEVDLHDDLIDGLPELAELTQHYAPATRWYDPLMDVSCGIRHLKGQAEALNINPDQIGLIGFSSGSNLALQTAYGWDKDEIVLNPHDDHAIDDSVAAVFAMDAMPDSLVALRRIESLDVISSYLREVIPLVIKRKFPEFADVFFKDGTNDVDLEFANDPVSNPDALNTLRNFSATEFITADTDLPSFLMASNGFGSGACYLWEAALAESNVQQFEQVYTYILTAGVRHSNFYSNSTTANTALGRIKVFFDYHLKGLEDEIPANRLLVYSPDGSGTKSCDEYFSSATNGTGVINY